MNPVRNLWVMYPGTVSKKAVSVDIFTFQLIPYAFLFYKKECYV